MPSTTSTLLKVDIEGSEAEVFQAVEPWMDRGDRVVVEIHDKYIAGDLVRHTMRDAGFKSVPGRRNSLVTETPNRVELFVRD